MTFSGSGVEKQPSRQPHKLETAGASPATAPPLTLVAVAYLTEDEAATYLRVSPNTLRGWRVSGKGPRYRDHAAGASSKGGRIVYALVDLDKWSESRARLSTSDVTTEAANSTT